MFSDGKFKISEKESFVLITKDGDLIKPSIYSIFVAIFFTVVSVMALFVFNLMSTDLFHVLSFLSIVSAIVRVVTGVLRGGANRNRGVAGGIAGMILGFIERVWTVATYFIMKKNLIPIVVGEVAVGFVTGVLSIIGFIIAIVIGFALFGAIGGTAGTLLALLVAAILIVLVIALSMYVTTAYHTCLFLWARNVEDSRTGIPGTIKPPAPLANALNA